MPRILGALSRRQHTASLDSVSQPSPRASRALPLLQGLCANFHFLYFLSLGRSSLESPTMTPPGPFPQLYLLICSWLQTPHFHLLLSSTVQLSTVRLHLEDTGIPSAQEAQSWTHLSHTCTLAHKNSLSPLPLFTINYPIIHLTFQFRKKLLMLKLLWLPDAKTWLTRKDSDAGKDWGQEEKGATEDEMVAWHHRFNGHEFEQTPGDTEGQGSLECCSPWDHRDSDMTEQLKNNIHFSTAIPPWKGSISSDLRS